MKQYTLYVPVMVVVEAPSDVDIEHIKSRVESRIYINEDNEYDEFTIVETMALKSSVGADTDI